MRWGGYNHPVGMAVHDVMGSMFGPEEVMQPGFVFACDIHATQAGRKYGDPARRHSGHHRGWM